MFVSAPPRSDAAQRIYDSNLASQGYVMNLTRLWAWRPDVFEGFAALRAQLTSHSTLSRRDLSVLVSATAAAIGDSYCALAWGTTLAQEADPALAATVLASKEPDALPPRDRALAAWARKVARDPNGTRAADVSELRDAGLGEREIVEATLFVVFRLAFSTFNDALGVNPDREIAAAAPPEVVHAVDFGRPVSATPSKSADG